jgi:hypothetical protein
MLLIGDPIQRDAKHMILITHLGEDLREGGLKNKDHKRSGEQGG